MKIERKWGMPSRWTFSIDPIARMLARYVHYGEWIDPFAGKTSPAKIRNDMNPKVPAEYHMDALDFLKMLPDRSADGVLFDPPYSPSQVKECYEGLGTPLTGDKTKMSYWSDCKKQIDRVLRPGGYVICFGWNSMGIGMKMKYEMEYILLVPHGGGKNDTICVVQKKRQQLF